MQALSIPLANSVAPSLVGHGFQPNPEAEAVMLERLQHAIRTNLAPQVCAIDHGYYPQAFLQDVGALGGFGQAVSPIHGGAGHGLKAAIQVISAISQECMSTGFMAWCQIACTWYMQNSENDSLKAQILPLVATGQALGGTGLSNPIKHFAGIEKIALKAERQPGGYRVNGLLPWVSNIGPGHYFGMAAQIAGTDAYLMAIVSDQLPGLELRCNAHFIALEGTNTLSCHFRDVFIPDEWVLAAPADTYVQKIRPGFMLTQVGMGLGLVTSCLEIMQRSNQRYGHVNCFLEDGVEELSTDLALAQQITDQLADQLDGLTQINTALFKQVIQARITASELSLRAAQAAMLHTGARGYLQGAAVERKLRESYFVAIVTPALKQLKKMLHDLD
jgi:alkylation response protein AidB-like acyl-CoA dehydrogenase